MVNYENDNHNPHHQRDCRSGLFVLRMGVAAMTFFSLWSAVLLHHGITTSNEFVGTVCVISAFVFGAIDWFTGGLDL